MFGKLNTHQYHKFSLIVSYILRYINERNFPDFKSFEKSIVFTQIKKTQLDLFKPFYPETPLDSVIALMLPIFHSIESEDHHLNQILRVEIPKYFDLLK